METERESRIRKLDEMIMKKDINEIIKEIHPEEIIDEENPITDDELEEKYEKEKCECGNSTFRVYSTCGTDCRAFCSKCNKILYG